VSQIISICSQEKNSKSTSPTSIIPGIALWLKSLFNESGEYSQSELSIAERFSFYINVHTVKCYFRQFCMFYLRGMFVKKGMSRDFFPPIYVE